MPRYEFEGKKPVIGKDTFVHETAVMIGDVTIGDGCYIGAGAVMRADFGPIKIGNNSSVQDNCVMHTRPNVLCSVGDNVTIGHSTILHACTIKDRAVVGMGSVVSDFSVVGEDSIVGEMSLVKSKTNIEPGVLAVGNPAQVKGPLKDQQKMIKDAGNLMYCELAKRCLSSCKRLDD